MSKVRIWKYVLELQDYQTIVMSEGAQILSVAVQGAGRSVYDKGDICLWAMVDTSKASERRHIEIIGTGNPVPDDKGLDRKFIGTVQQGPFVWHIFEKIDMSWLQGDANDD